VMLRLNKESRYRFAASRNNNVVHQNYLIPKKNRNKNSLSYLIEIELYVSSIDINSKNRLFVGTFSKTRVFSQCDLV
jgi:hypothetical protein